MSLCACGRDATTFIEVHAVDECRPNRRTVSGEKCQICLARNLQRIANVIRDGGYDCTTCGLHIDSMYAIIVTQCPLAEAT